MPLTVTVNTIAECLRTDCNSLGDKQKNVLILIYLFWLLGIDKLYILWAVHRDIFA